MNRAPLFACVACCLVLMTSLLAEPYKPFVKEPDYLKGLAKKNEFKVSLFANKDYVHNPISLAVDAQGRVYVAEIGRFLNGVPDTRRHQVWFMEETKLISLPQRERLFDKYVKSGRFKKGHFTSHRESLVWLQDTDGDGVADKRVVFDDDYSEALMGNGSSILLHPDGDLLYANIPDIWKVGDRDGDGKADERISLSYGYGLRMGVNGHDLHGLEWGVDGRLYFSNGDRGYNIRRADGVHLYDPERGAIFRCEPDGSGLEVYTTGNRNPQDISFNHEGFLVSVDNNQGRRDRSRYYYVVEGGDYGWNSGYENKSTFKWATQHARREGPQVSWDWFDERTWDKPHKGQPAFSIPSMAFCGSGPCGITIVPGLSLGKEYANHFMFSDYSEGIYAFRVEQDGAGLKVVNNHTFFKGGLVIDSEFGSDGKFYIADYVNTYNNKDGSHKGNIYMLHHPKHILDPSVRSADVILKKGFKQTSSEELEKQLRHQDYRVRLFSQFELAWRGKASIAAFKRTLQSKDHLHSRLHALWGLGMLARKYQGINAEIEPLLKDENPLLRLWAARMLGESLVKPSVDLMLSMLKDSNAGVRGAAAVALGRIGDISAVPLMLAELEKNNNQDVFLRHFLVYGLTLMGQREVLAQQIKHKSSAVRLGVLLAMTRLRDTRIDRFLNDADPFIVQETIRAIYRTDMVRSLPALADHAKKYHQGYTQSLPHYQFERIIQANVRLGLKKHAENLLGMVMNKALPGNARHLALCELKRWYIPQEVDGVAFQVRSYNHSRYNIDAMMKEVIPNLMAKSDGGILDTVVSLATHYKVPLDSKVIVKQVKNERSNLGSRLSQLDSLSKSNYKDIIPLCESLLSDRHTDMRKKAFQLLLQKDQAKAVNALNDRIVKKKDLRVTYAIISSVNTPEVNRLLANALETLAQGKHPRDSQLDLILACENKKDPVVKQALAKYNEAMDKQGPLAKHRPMLYGGNSRIGGRLVRNHGRAQCLVCHKVQGRGGVVGPDLSDVGKIRNEDHLLESMIDPSAFVAPGYGNMTIELKDGKTVIGSPFKEDDKTITLLLPDKSKQVVQKSDVKTRGKAISAMPPMTAILKKEEIRHIISYLRTLKHKAKH